MRICCQQNLVGLSIRESHSLIWATDIMIIFNRTSIMGMDSLFHILPDNFLLAYELQPWSFSGYYWPGE